MPTKILTKLDDLLFHELQDLYDAEHRILKALPKMAKKASHPELKKAFETHLRETEEHVTRLERAFKSLGKKATKKTCEGIKGLLKEGEEALKEKMKPDVRDAALIGAAQRVEHYEMAGYGCARTYAHLLGYDEAGKLLQETLDEEGDTDHALTRLAETVINVEAMA
jgi:ferritin-like metal-binding protein YciE